MTGERKPTILVFVGYYVPGWKAGGILRSVENEVNHLHREFNFRIVTRDRDLGDKSAYPGVRCREWQPVGNALVNYLPPAGDSLRELRDIVRSTPHDLVHLNSFFDSFTVKILTNRWLGRTPSRPIILSPCGEFGQASLGQKHLKKVAFTRLARLAGLYRPVTWKASSQHEAADIRNVMRVRNSSIRIVTDMPKVLRNAAEDASGFRRAAGQDGLRVTFFSRIAPEKGLDVAVTILAMVQSRVTFDIIGPIENTGYWNTCQKLISELPSHVSANVLGSISPSEVIRTLSRYDLMLLPTGGENWGHVIAECLAAGTPVLISTNTPWRDLEAQGLGWDLPLNDLGAFARVIDELASTGVEVREQKRKAINEAARELLAAPSILEQNQQLYLRGLARDQGWMMTMSGAKATYRRMRRAVHDALGLDLHFPVQTSVPVERHGSEYGGWWICPRDMAQDSVVYSVGIGTEITFDLSLIEKYGVTIHAFDPTPASLAYLKTRLLPSRYKWYPFGVAGRDGLVTFFPPPNREHVSHTVLNRPATSDRAIKVEVRRLSTIMRDLGHQRIDVLKMDIEGAEYEVLQDILNDGLEVRQILVEFHHRFAGVGISRTRRAVNALNAADYRIFSASDSGEEYSFIRAVRSEGVPGLNT